jgi:hypothetical protein
MVRDPGLRETVGRGGELSEDDRRLLRLRDGRRLRIDRIADLLGRRPEDIAQRIALLRSAGHRFK